MPGGSFFVQQSAFGTRRAHLLAAPGSQRGKSDPPAWTDDAAVALDDPNDSPGIGGQADANVLTAREGWGGQPGHGPRSPSSLILRPSSGPGPSSWVP